VGVVEPRGDGDGVVGVEDVGGGGVVEDDGVGDGSAELGEVFDVVALVGIAALAEEAVGDGLVDIEFVKDGVGVLGKC
jgi:hypothetical protein